MLAIPTVTIGLPVHNGAQHVAEAIEAILGQTLADFELIISDNASTDATPTICQRYAAADRRIRYHRHERNLGAARNFNFVVQRATGRYFKWAAHDDLVHPTYLERCVAALEAAPDAVLCQSLVRIADAGNPCRELYDHTAFGTDRPRQSERLAARLRARRCMDVFGVIRTGALRGTALIADHVGADRTLLIELALRGRFIGVPVVLFVNRDHPGRFTRRHRSLQEQASWFAPRAPRPRVLRTWDLYLVCLRLVSRYVGGAAERRRCYLTVALSLRHHRRWFRLVMEPVEALVPRAASCERWLSARGAALKRALRRGAAAVARRAPATTPERSRPRLPL